MSRLIHKSNILVIWAPQFQIAKEMNSNRLIEADGKI